MPESPPNVLKTYLDDPAAAPLAKLEANAISGALDVFIVLGSNQRRLSRRFCRSTPLLCRAGL